MSAGRPRREAPELADQLRPHLPEGLAALLVLAPVPDAAVAGPRWILPDELDWLRQVLAVAYVR